MHTQKNTFPRQSRLRVGLLVSVAELTALDVHQIPELDVVGELSQVDLKVKSDIGSKGIGIIQLHTGSGHVPEAGGDVAKLPHPEETIKVTVMEVEDRVTGGVVGVSKCPKSSSNTKVGTTVDCEC